MEFVFGEALKQIILVIFYIIIIMIAVKLGIYMAKKKNEKLNNAE